VSRRPPAGLRDGYYYSKAAALDAYELIRQLIDGMDEFEGLLVAVLVPQEMVNDEAAGCRPTRRCGCGWWTRCGIVTAATRTPP